MTKTEELVDALVESAAPVRRLRPPLIRAGLWLLFAALVLGLIALTRGVRPDLSERIREPAFVVGMLAALATGILAAVSSFRISLPDRSRWGLLLPLPALALWISTIGYGCVADWIGIGSHGVHFGEAVRCLVTLLMTSVPLSASMLIMLRYAALVHPMETSMTGGLAIAALTAFALSLFHDLDASVMILMWNLGSAAMIALLGAVFGRTLLTWAAARLKPAV